MLIIEEYRIYGLKSGKTGNFMGTENMPKNVFRSDSITHFYLYRQLLIYSIGYYYYVKSRQLPVFHKEYFYNI